MSSVPWGARIRSQSAPQKVAALQHEIKLWSSKLTSRLRKTLDRAFSSKFIQLSKPPRDFHFGSSLGRPRIPGVFSKRPLSLTYNEAWRMKLLSRLGKPLYDAVVALSRRDSRGLGLPCALHVADRVPHMLGTVCLTCCEPCALIQF